MFRFDKKRIVLALAANVAGVTLQGAALSLLVYYANLMESGESFSLLRFNLETRDQATFLGVVAVIGAFLLVSAGLIFSGSRLITNIALDFASHCSQRVLALAAARPPHDVAPSEAPYPNRVSGRATGLVTIARAVRPLMQLSNPLAMLAYSIVVLLYIDPLLTFGVAMFVVPSLFFQYLVNYIAAQNEKRMPQARARSHRRIMRLLKGFA